MPTTRRVAASRRITGAVRTSHPHNPPPTPEALLSVALGDAELTLAVPTDATLPQVEETLKLAIAGHRLLTDAAEKIKPLIGRMLLIIQERTLYKPAFKNFTDYVEQRVVKEMQMSRSSAFDALKIARAFPSMSAKEYTNYGATRLLLASKVTNEKAANHKEILDKAVHMSVSDFENQIKLAHVANTPNNATTSEAPVTISIKASPECRDRWQALLNASGLLAADLLNRMMDREIAATSSLAAILTPASGAARH